MGKIHAFFRSLGETLWGQEIVGLIDTPQSTQDEYLSKGGNSNTTSESAFSLCRMMGSKLPYRPVKLALFETNWRGRGIITIFLYSLFAISRIFRLT